MGGAQPRRSGTKFSLSVADQEMRTIFVSAVALLTTVTGTLACSPAPSCWIKSGPEYLRSVCLGYAKEHQTLKQIALYVEEPEKIAAFGRTCEKLHIHLEAE